MSLCVCRLHYLEKLEEAFIFHKLFTNFQNAFKPCNQVRWISLSPKLSAFELTISLKTYQIFLSWQDECFVNRFLQTHISQWKISENRFVRSCLSCSIKPPGANSILCQPSLFLDLKWILIKYLVEEMVCIKCLWALLYAGLAVRGGPRATAECKAPARKQSHIWSMTMNFSEEKAALIKEDQRQGFKKASEDELCLVS